MAARGGVPAAERSGRVVLVRHGGTAWSASGRHTGRTDVPLTERGRQEARALAGRLAGWSFDRVLCSPLRRAVETCALAGLDRHAELCADLREWDYGAYEGRTSAEIRRERPGWLLWTDGVPGGETLQAVGHRADRVVAELRRRDADQAVVAHGHILRVLAARWLGLPAAAGRLLALDPATLSVLGYEHGLPALRRWNDASHLEALAGG